VNVFAASKSNSMVGDLKPTPEDCGRRKAALTSLFVFWLFGFFASAFAQDAASTAAPAGSAYTLGAGDQVSIQVYGEPEMSIQTRIAANGRLTYPFLGELDVTGLSPRQLETRIMRGLKGDFLVDPKVSVTITEYRPVFVNGQVKSPGGFPYQPGLTVRKALSLAGGMTERGSEKRLSVISEDDKQQGRNKGRSVRMDDLVGPGDIVTVDESFF
jgi:polysaccharide biosynthesis/export protein VpsN